MKLSGGARLQHDGATLPHRVLNSQLYCPSPFDSTCLKPAGTSNKLGSKALVETDVTSIVMSISEPAVVWAPALGCWGLSCLFFFPKIPPRPFAIGLPACC